MGVCSLIVEQWLPDPAVRSEKQPCQVKDRGCATQVRYVAHTTPKHEVSASWDNATQRGSVDGGLSRRLPLLYIHMKSVRLFASRLPKVYCSLFCLVVAIGIIGGASRHCGSTASFSILRVKKTGVSIQKTVQSEACERKSKLLIAFYLMPIRFLRVLR